MRNTIFFAVLLLFVFPSCHKLIDLPGKADKESLTKDGFVKFTIKKGQQASDLNFITQSEYQELKFRVKFDSSAIYSTVTPENQGDINKLYGFSDNNAHHQQQSARFGWGWTEAGLSLYAYTYNNGKRENKLLGCAKIGEEIICSIKVAGDKYIFTYNDQVNTMPRSVTTPTAVGYKLFPYFGGDEMAPHDIFIWIKE